MTDWKSHVLYWGLLGALLLGLIYMVKPNPPDDVQTKDLLARSAVSAAVTDSASHIVVTVHKDEVTTIKPDGTKTTVNKDFTTTETVKDVKSETKSSESEKSEKSEKKEYKGYTKWRAGIDLGLTTSSSRAGLPVGLAPPGFTALVPLDYGLHVERRIGKSRFWLGGRISSDKSIGLSLSGEF